MSIHNIYIYIAISDVQQVGKAPRELSVRTKGEAPALGT